jgi:uncharacterized membrane protein YeaQ/YmgE (transglycosylase-associated protein family)
MALNSIIVWIIVGGVAGLLAELLVGGVHMGCVSTVIIGVLGAFVGGWLFRELGISIGSGILNNIVTALVGAVVLVLIIRILRRG